jgi:hypothetical protein
MDKRLDCVRDGVAIDKAISLFVKSRHIGTIGPIKVMAVIL